MTYDRRKYEYYFPRKVYRCACLGQVITHYLHNVIYALSDIIDEIKQIKYDGDENKKIFCVKCGDNISDVVFTCGDHMTVLIFVAKLVQSYPTIQILLLTYLMVVRLIVAVV